MKTVKLRKYKLNESNNFDYDNEPLSTKLDIILTLLSDGIENNDFSGCDVAIEDLTTICKSGQKCFYIPKGSRPIKINLEDVYII